MKRMIGSRSRPTRADHSVETNTLPRGAQCNPAINGQDQEDPADKSRAGQKGIKCASTCQDLCHGRVAQATSMSVVSNGRLEDGLLKRAKIMAVVNEARPRLIRSLMARPSSLTREAADDIFQDAWLYLDRRVQGSTRTCSHHAFWFTCEGKLLAYFSKTLKDGVANYIRRQGRPSFVSLSAADDDMGTGVAADVG